MQPSERQNVFLSVLVTVLVSVCQVARATDVPMTREIQAIVDFQCHQAKTVKQAETNYANMGRGYTDAHPVMECLKKKIEELRAAGK